VHETETRIKRALLLERQRPREHWLEALGMKQVLINKRLLHMLQTLCFVLMDFDKRMETSWKMPKWQTTLRTALKASSYYSALF
jgi:hypothetical protein